MKKLSTLFALLILIALTIHAQSWNFTSVKDADIANIQADIAAQKGTWVHNTSDGKDLYGSLTKHEKEAVTANNVELEYTKGLLFTYGSSTGDGTLRIDKGKSRMWFGNGSITIPNLTAGLVVTVNYMSSSKDVARGISVTNLTATSGKFGQNVQNVLKKCAALDIEKICALHGPILSENLGYYLGLYDTWSKYEPEEKGVTLAYTSVYGNTKNAVLFLKEALEERGVHVALFDLARDDMAEAVEDAFKLDRIVLATTTYCGDIFPFMKNFLHCLQEHNYQNRKVAFMENGMWMPSAIKGMKTITDTMKNLTYLENNVTFKGACNDAVKEQILKLADELKALD